MIEFIRRMYAGLQFRVMLNVFFMPGKGRLPNGVRDDVRTVRASDPEYGRLKGLFETYVSSGVLPADEVHLYTRTVDGVTFDLAILDRDAGGFILAAGCHDGKTVVIPSQGHCFPTADIPFLD